MKVVLGVLIKGGLAIEKKGASPFAQESVSLRQVVCFGKPHSAVESRLARGKPAVWGERKERKKMAGCGE